MKLGLIAGALSTVLVSWLSLEAGFPPEAAILRGLVAFMAVTFVGYLGELVVATAPRVPGEEAMGVTGRVAGGAATRGDASGAPVAIERPQTEQKAA
jgi:hypothetical protein